MQRTLRWLAGVCLCCAACGTSPSTLAAFPEGVDSNEGQLKLSMRSRLLDVAQLRVDVSQNANTVCSQTLSVGMQPLPADPNHAVGMGGDALFLLASGNYGVTATPLNGDGNTLSGCAPAKQDGVKVKPGQTTEIQLTIRCDSVNPGLLDATVVVETAPVLNSLTVSPNKFPCAGHDATIAAVFVDPSGADVDISAQVVQGPSGGNVKLDVESTGIVFASDTPGDYIVQVTGKAPLGTATSQLVPIHVQPADDLQCNDVAASRP